MNYNNNQNQVDISYDQMNNVGNISNNYLNNIGNTGNNILNTGYSNNYLGSNTNQSNMFGNMSNDNLINIANDIDPNLLNGTSLEDNDISRIYSQKNKNNDNKSLIKSLTKEIINNLKENNMSLYDNSSINSRNRKIISTDDCDENYIDENISHYSSNSSNSLKKIKKNKKKKEITDIKETIEDFVVNNEAPNPKDYLQWFFDDCFNYKDFLILFIVYFVLSQEMIKDFFAKYFSSLNPDDEGKIGVQGVIIYGLVLSILFMIMRKFF